MKKIWFVSIFLIMFLGCEALQTATPENPLGSLDPNQVQAGLETAVSVGQTTQTFGMLVGNPAVIGTGILIMTIGGLLLANFKKKPQ